MTRYGKLVGLTALLATTLAGSMALGSDPELPRDDVQRQLRDLRDELARLQRIQAMSDEMTNRQLRLLNERLELIERSLAARPTPPPPANTRTSSYYTPDAAPVRRSALRLDNQMPVTAYVTVNGVTYSVPAYQVRMLRNVVPGEVVYSTTGDGPGVQPPRRTYLDPNETLTLTIRDTAAVFLP